LTFSYDSTFAANKNKGVEMKIPLSAFAGVDTSQTVRFFVVLSPQNGKTSNECIPGDPGAANPGDGGDFSVIPNQDFFTGAVNISGQAISLAVNTTELNIGPAAGSTATFNVTSNTDWIINTGQSWLSAVPASGTGNEMITLTAQANNLPNNRTATVTVSGLGAPTQTIQVAQSINTAIEAADEGHLSIYPNPFTDGINVMGIKTRAVLTLTDLTGRVLLIKETEGDVVLGTSSLPTGIFILKVVTDNNIMRQVLVKR